MSAAHEHHVTVSRTARYYTLGDTAAPCRELWVVCHGHGQLAGRWIRHFEPIARDGRVVCAPEALSRYYLDAPQHGVSAADRRVGATWMTREDRASEISDYVAYLDVVRDRVTELLPSSPRRVVAFGFSQGAATAARWAMLGRTEVSHLVLWAGGYPPDLDARTEPPAITVVGGTADPLATPDRVAEERARLASLGLAFDVMTFDGGHHVDAPTLAALAARLSRDAG